MLLYRLWLIVFISTFMVVDASAQPKTSFTINDLIAISLESSPQVLAARDQSKAIKGQLSTARAIPNPEFEISTGQQRSVTGPLTVGNVSSWSVTQPLDMPYTRFPRVNAAEANLRAAEATRIAFEVETISKVQQRFYELMRREAEQKAAEEDMSLTKQIRDRMQIRYDVGETARFELIRVQTEFLNAQIAAESSKLRVEQARSQLRQVVGHQLPADFTVVAEQPKVEDLPSLQVLLNEVQAQSPELQKAKAEVEATESKLSFEKNLRLPRLAFKASQYNDPNFTDRLYGLQVSIPIWDFRGGQVAEAEANASKAKNQLNAQSQTLDQQIETAYKLYQMTSYQVKVLSQEVVQLAASAQRIAEVSYRYGERGMLEYLDAQRTFRAARNDLIRARFDLAYVVTEIQRLRASPEWLAKIESGMQ
ncbi:TolC family protein [Polynucleobacter sp. MWH-UH35A]|uniref:TolC family protein n=1 Tax=Polynucleobacter sp. MWH-UH35A TaxID=1855619 RepID=UPI001BFE4C86|nr:TolC family protein [Polynucleobacter sp. MWH-UH35A]QWD59557.1 TolC family protein [Polynucleobacter sp. MWH-UH35A]